MEWPRGRYNGQRIVGVMCKVVVDITDWRLRWGSVLHGTCWIVGPLHVWIGAAYDWEIPLR